MHRRRNTTQTHRQNLSLWVNKYTATVAFIGVLITSITYFLILNTFLNKTIERIVNKKLTPYQQVATGLSLNQTEDFDQAVGVFQALQKDLNDQKLSDEMNNLFYDGLLYAIVNSTSPLQYAPDLNKIRSRLGTVVPESGWRQHQFGWFYLRTGNLTEARIHFNRALQLYNDEHKWREGADAIRGLVFLELANGNDEAALLRAIEADKRNPVNNDIKQFAKEIKTFKNESWIMSLSSLYAPKFDISLLKLQSHINKR